MIKLYYHAIIKLIIDEFWFFCFIHSSFVNIVVFWFIKRYTKYKYTGAFIYYTLLSIGFCTEILRESVAICLFLLSIPYLQENKWAKYFILSLVGFSMHLSAIITLFIPLIYPFLSKEFKFDRLILASVAVILISIASSQILENILVRFSSFSSITTRVLFYSNATQVGLSSNDGIGGTNISLRWLLSVVMAVMSLIVLKKAKFNNPLYFFVFNSFLIITLFSFAFGLMASRMLNYFKLFYYIILINILFEKNNSIIIRKKMKSEVVILFMYFYFIMIAHWFDPADIGSRTKIFEKFYPYSSILAPHEYPPREKQYQVY